MVLYSADFKWRGSQNLGGDNMKRILSVILMMTMLFSVISYDYSFAHELPEMIVPDDDITPSGTDRAEIITESVTDMEDPLETDREDGTISDENCPDQNDAAGFAPPLPVPSLSGNWRKDFINVARSQLGYHEAYDGSTCYGDWFGTPYCLWCSEFASWCAHAAGIPDSVIKPSTSTNRFIGFFAPQGRYFYVEGGIDGSKTPFMQEAGYDNIPKIKPEDLEPGDLLMMETHGDPENGPDHTAIFLGWSGDQMINISGNCNDQVMITTRSISNLHGVCKPRFDGRSRTDLSDSDTSVILSETKYTYDGSIKRPSVTVKCNGKTLVSPNDYLMILPKGNPVHPGTYELKIIGSGKYTGSVRVSYKIAKAANPLKISGKSITIKKSSIKQKDIKYSISKVIDFSKKGKGTLSYSKIRGSKKIIVDERTGKITVKKGLKKGYYSVKIRVSAAGTRNYKPANKNVNFTIEVY